MPAIQKLEIKGFKAFPNKFELTLNGNHLLLYGENGSGKSSIYYALHCIFQSPFKQDGGKKYFDKNNPQNLINVNSSVEDSYVALTFMPPHPWIYKIDIDGYNTELLGGVKPLPSDLYNNVFINHKFISNFSACRNSEYIDLFTVFYKDIFPYILVKTGGQILADKYDYIINNPSRRKEYRKDIDALNQETKHWIDSMNLNISDIYNNSFRDEEDNKLKIKLLFQEQPESINGETIYYWGRYDYRTYKEIVANVPVVKKANRKSFIEPHIGLKIEEILPDGKSRIIEKPQTYFNEAKLTAIALAIRFSILDNVADANGRFMALDDMLISLDMSNRTKVIDYLLNISDKYKIYLFTHDRAFYNYICHKIQQYKKSEEWVYKTISYNSKNNEPIIIDEYSDYLSKAKHFYQIGDYDTSAIYLRKQLEQSVGELLPYELKANVDGGFVGLKTLWEKLLKFYSANKQNINISIQKKFTDSKLLILNPAAHFQRLSNPIYRTELKIAFEIVDYLQTLNKIDNKLVIMSGQQIIFQHPKRNYKCSFELDSDLEIIQNEHIVAKIPKCKKIRWTYDGIENWDFDKNTQNNNHPLLISTPKITRFFNDCCEKLPLGITHEMLMKHCKINGETPLIDYFAGIDMLKLSVKI